MKRSQPLRRAPIKRGKPLRPMSAKRRADNATRRRNMVEAFGTNPVCAIRWDANCAGWADAPHELRKRSAGGSIIDPANCIPACHYCNGAVEDWPDEAHRRGFVIRRGDEAA